MTEQAAAEAAIRAAIEELYRVFARYQFRRDMPYCHHCHTETDIRKVGSKRLRELTADDLRDYAFSAIYTWGDEYDFRHFLPRIFEIISFEGFRLPDAEMVLGRLPYGRWQEWPHDQREAVKRFLVALWHWHLSHFDRALNASRGDILGAIASVEDDLLPYLQAWDDDRSAAATRHIADQVFGSGAKLSRGRLSNAFLRDRPEQQRQVADWLLRPEALRRLEEACIEATDEESAADLGYAFDMLAPLVFSG